MRQVLRLWPVWLAILVVALIAVWWLTPHYVLITGSGKILMNAHTLAQCRARSEQAKFDLREFQDEDARSLKLAETVQSASPLNEEQTRLFVAWRTSAVSQRQLLVEWATAECSPIRFGMPGY